VTSVIHPRVTPGTGAARAGSPTLGTRRQPRPLRVALLTYRGNPRCGGQGVYVNRLSRALSDLGHSVEVISGPPYPVVAGGVKLTRLPSLDLYRQPDPFRVPHPREFHSAVDVAEFALMCTGTFPEPLTFSLRARRHLERRLGDFDVIHDNQGLGYGMLALARGPVPLVTTIHHPILVDRELDLAAAANCWRRLTLRRWYGFLRMQRRVAASMDRVITVSESSRQDIARTMGVDLDRISVVRLGVDADIFRPLPEVPRVPGRILTTTSADVPLKGLVTLVRAMSRLRLTRPDAHLVIVGQPRPDGAVARTLSELDLGEAVRFAGGISDEGLVKLYAEAELAVVPSLYEGFSLPAVEAMACGVPLVATTGGALPEVAGLDGETALLVPPGDDQSLATVIDNALGNPALRAHVGAAGRVRALELYTWEAAARGTAEQYRMAIGRC
jgi:glycosyltransferase involved in cell wall biosynthesis